MGENRIDALVNRSTPAPSRQTTDPPGESTPSPPSNQPPPSGKDSGEVRFSPSEVKQLGLNIERELEPIFKQARYKLNGTPRDLEASAFGTFGFALAMAHTEVIEYADQDLITKSELAMKYNDRLQKTAINQDEGDRKSTIKGIG
jgi:hypothetical protein